MNLFYSKVPPIDCPSVRSFSLKVSRTPLHPNWTSSSFGHEDPTPFTLSPFSCRLLTSRSRNSGINPDAHFIIRQGTNNRVSFKYSFKTIKMEWIGLSLVKIYKDETSETRLDSSEWSWYIHQRILQKD